MVTNGKVVKQTYLRSRAGKQEDQTLPNDLFGKLSPSILVRESRWRRIISFARERFVSIDEDNSEPIQYNDGSITIKGSLKCYLKISSPDPAN